MYMQYAAQKGEEQCLHMLSVNNILKIWGNRKANTEIQVEEAKYGKKKKKDKSLQHEEGTAPIIM